MLVYRCVGSTPALRVTLILERGTFQCPSPCDFGLLALWIQSRMMRVMLPVMTRNPSSRKAVAWKKRKSYISGLRKNKEDFRP